MEVEYAPRAELWRINSGWRRSKQRDGFVIDPDSGRWAKRADDEIGDDTVDDQGLPTQQMKVKPFGRDLRNVLLLKPLGPKARDDAFLDSLAVAISAGSRWSIRSRRTRSPSRLGPMRRTGATPDEQSRG